MTVETCLILVPGALALGAIGIGVTVGRLRAIDTDISALSLIRFAVKVSVVGGAATSESRGLLPEEAAELVARNRRCEAVCLTVVSVVLAVCCVLAYAALLNHGRPIDSANKEGKPPGVRIDSPAAVSQAKPSEPPVR
jgi:hypothetical protein